MVQPACWDPCHLPASCPAWPPATQLCRHGRAQPPGLPPPQTRLKSRLPPWDTLPLWEAQTALYPGAGSLPSGSPREPASRAGPDGGRACGAAPCVLHTLFRRSLPCPGDLAPLVSHCPQAQDPGCKRCRSKRDGGSSGSPRARRPAGVGHRAGGAAWASPVARLLGFQGCHLHLMSLESGLRARTGICPQNSPGIPVSAPESHHNGFLGTLYPKPARGSWEWQWPQRHCAPFPLPLHARRPWIPPRLLLEVPGAQGLNEFTCQPGSSLEGHVHCVGLASPPQATGWGWHLC